LPEGGDRGHFRAARRVRAILRSLAADEAAAGTEQSLSINCTLEKYAMSYHIGVVRALGSSRVQVHIEQGYRSSSASHRSS
jgi:hypothetical protein